MTCPGVLQNVFSLNSQTSPAHSPAIAFIRPVFTAAAYKGYPDKSFYGFYKKYSNVSEGMIVKTDLNLLNTTVDKDDWGDSWGLASYLHSEEVKDAQLFNSATTLTDVDVNDGNLFYAMNGARRFDVAVLGFSEYVTASEYQNYKRFVEIGGGMFLLDGCNFVAEVNYNPAANKVSLVKGHGWESNGAAAWRGPYHRWPTENTNWVGSNFALFRKTGYLMNGAIANTTHPLSMLLRDNFGPRVFTSYAAHEENAMTNSSNKVIAFWNVTHLKMNPMPTVAVYEHEYLKGMVIHTGIFGSDLISRDPCMEFFLTAAIQRLVSHSATVVPEFRLPEIVIALTVGISTVGLSHYRKRRQETTL
jgi:hypothetical protein